MLKLAAIDKNSILFTEDKVSFALLRPRKTQHNRPLRSFSLRVFQNRSICPVACLGIYFVLSDYLRTEDNGNNLFVDLNYPNKPVTGNTIGRWVKTYLSKAGIDTSVFSTNSTREAAALEAVRCGGTEGGTAPGGAKKTFCEELAINGSTPLGSSFH